MGSHVKPRAAKLRSHGNSRTASSSIFESLEDRRLLSTVYVDNDWTGTTAGTDPDGAGPATSFGTDSFATIQTGINAAAAGDAIHVLAGTYDEDVNVNKNGIQLLGAGASNTTISGVIGGSGASVQITGSNVEVAGFTITRAGNNLADWNNPGLNSAGVAIQGLAITGAVIHDNSFVGNRTGIDINNSNGHTIRNNEINDNRTGLIFRNQTNGLTVTENEIKDNWTVGILFLDASGGTNAPVQSALNSTFSNNDLSGNWYGQIVDRQSGGVLPAPGTTNLKNFSGNWFGTASPVVTTANSAEPGYAAQIPVAYGGTAVAPGGQPDIAGAASANFDITPLLTSGADTSAAFGFQGDFSDLLVTDQLAQTGAVGRIAEGINRVDVGGTVNVSTGVFNENVTIAKSITLDGAGSGNADTILSAAGNVVTIGVNDVSVRDVRVTGGTRGVLVNGVSNTTLDNVAAVLNSSGVEVGGTTAADLSILNSSLSNNTVGFRMGTAANLDGLVIDGSTFDGNTAQGIAVFTTPAGSYLTNVEITDTSFVNNAQKGAYFEKLNDALFDNITVQDSGTDPAYAFNNGIDINLKHGAYSNITIQNSLFSGSGVRTVYGPGGLDFAAALAIKARDDAPSYNTVPATLTDVHVKDNVFQDSIANQMTTAIRIGEPGKNNVGPTSVVICGNTLSDGGFVGVDNQSLASVNAEHNWWGTADGNVIGSQLAIGGNVDYTPWLTQAPGSANSLFYSDGANSLTVDTITGTYTLVYNDGAIWKTATGDGATILNGALRIHDQSSDGKMDAKGDADGEISVYLRGRASLSFSLLLIDLQVNC